MASKIPRPLRVILSIAQDDTEGDGEGYAYNKKLLLLVRFYPLASIDECFNPRSDLVIPTFSWVVAALPWEDGTFRVWHDSQVATVLAGYGSYTVR